MNECQRCPAPIVEAANQLMGLYPTAAMVPVSSRPANTHVVVWNTPKEEAAGMAQAIIKNIRTLPDDSHLVMTTRCRFGYWLRDTIEAIDSDVSVDLCYSESLLETWAVREAFLMFCLVVDPDAPTWRAWFAYMNSSTGSDYKASNRNANAYLQFLTRCGDHVTWDHVRDLANCKR